MYFFYLHGTGMEQDNKALDYLINTLKIIKYDINDIFFKDFYCMTYAIYREYWDTVFLLIKLGLVSDEQMKIMQLEIINTPIHNMIYLLKYSALLYRPNDITFNKIPNRVLLHLLLYIKKTTVINYTQLSAFLNKTMEAISKDTLKGTAFDKLLIKIGIIPENNNAFLTDLIYYGIDYDPNIIAYYYHLGYRYVNNIEKYVFMRDFVSFHYMNDANASTENKRKTIKFVEYIKKFGAKVPKNIPYFTIILYSQENKVIFNALVRGTVNLTKESKDNIVYLLSWAIGTNNIDTLKIIISLCSIDIEEYYKNILNTKETSNNVHLDGTSYLHHGVMIKSITKNYIWALIKNNKKKIRYYDDKETYEECTICLGAKKNLVKLLPCHHSGFCKDCVKKIDGKCPRCKKVFITYIHIS